jgi:transcriptional regulator with XRE-family HTH domain
MQLQNLVGGIVAAPQSPVGSRRRLGAELRRLRAKTGLTLDDVAELMTCSTSKISRLETGKGVPKVPDVRELMRIYGVTSDTEQDMLLRLVKDGRQHGWWEQLTEGLAPERYVMDSPGRYTALENDATAVRSFDITVVHGLLQTREYATAVLTALLPQHLPAEIDRLVRLRLLRQQALHRSDPPPLELVAVLDEAVLCRPVGGPETMHAQLQHLLDASELPTVSVLVLPFGADILRAHSGHFVLLEIPQEMGSDVVYIEGHAGEAYLDAESDVDLYQDVLSDALRHALPPDESRAELRRYQDRFAPPRKAPTP